MNKSYDKKLSFTTKLLFENVQKFQGHFNYFAIITIQSAAEGNSHYDDFRLALDLDSVQCVKLE